MVPETVLVPLVTSGPSLILVVGIPEVSNIMMFTVESLQMPKRDAFTAILSGPQTNPVMACVTITFFAALPCPPTVVTVVSGQSI
jgi:hypothetical protein